MKFFLKGIIVWCLLLSCFGFEVLKASLNSRQCEELKKRIPNLNCDLINSDAKPQLKDDLLDENPFKRRLNPINLITHDNFIVTSKTTEDLILKLELPILDIKRLRSDEFLKNLNQLSNKE